MLFPGGYKQKRVNKNLAVPLCSNISNVVNICQAFEKLHDIKRACLQGSWSTAPRIQHICPLRVKNVSLFAVAFPLFGLVGACILQ